MRPALKDELTLGTHPGRGRAGEEPLPCPLRSDVGEGEGEGKFHVSCMCRGTFGAIASRLTIAREFFINYREHRFVHTLLH